MKIKKEKTKEFDAVEFFRNIKEKMAAKMYGMSLDEQREFMKKIREGKIKIV